MSKLNLLKPWFIIILFLLELFCYPIAIIWSLNELFGLSIQLTWKTFIASFLLINLFKDTK